MKSISRRGFIKDTAIAVGAVLLPPFLRDHIFIESKLYQPWYLQSWYLYVQSRECRTRLNVDTLLQAAHLAGIDTIVYNVHEDGAHYNSAYYTRCSDIEPRFDPLGYLVQRGFELGISINAWMCPGVDCPQFDPNWDIAGKYGAPLTLHWLDFSIPDARARVRDVAADIASKYSVGICLDYIRYYRGVVPWLPGNHPELSAQDITTTVSMVQTAIAPRQLTVSVGAHNYKDVLQDWFSWMRLGIVETVQPRVYAYQIGQIPAWFAQWDTDIPLDKIVPCLSLYDLHVEPHLIKTTTELLIEINECKVLNLDNRGFAFFDSNGINSKNRALIRRTKFKNHNYQFNVPV